MVNRKRARVTSRLGKRRPNNQVSNNIRRNQPKSKGIVAVPRPRSKLSQAGLEFLRCALDPFNSKGSYGAPDHTALPSVVVDHRLTLNVSANANGEIGFCVLPTLPGALYIGTGVAAYPTWGTPGSVAGALTNAAGTYLGVPYAQYDTTGVQIGILPTWNLDGATSNPYTASKARVLSLSCRVTPSTQLLQAAGNIYVAQWSDANTLIGTGRCINAVNGAVIPATFDSASYPQRLSRPPNCNAATITGMPDYSQQFIADGAYIVGKRLDPDFEYQPWAPSYTALVAGANATAVPGGISAQMWQMVFNADGTTASNSAGVTDTCPKSVKSLVYAVQGLPGAGGGPAPVYSDGAGCCFVDPGMSSIVVALDGLQPSTATTPTAVEIEVRTCVQYQVRPNSLVAEFQKAPPPADPIAMQLLTDIMRKMPTAMPGSAVNGSWAATLRNVLMGMSYGGKQLSRLGLPYAGMVGEVADHLGGLFI